MTQQVHIQPAITAANVISNRPTVAPNAGVAFTWNSIGEK